MAQKVEYIVEVSRTGDGAAQAAQQLNQVNAAANNLNRSTASTAAVMSTANQRIVTLRQTSMATTAGLKSMSNVMLLLGGTAFPKATMGAIALKEAFRGLDIAAKAAKVSMASMLATTAPLVALAVAAGLTAKSFYDVAEAEKAAAAAGVAGEETLASRAEKLHAALVSAVEDGRAKITAQQASLWDAILAAPTDTSLRKMQQEVQKLFPNFMLAESDRGKLAGQAIADLERQIDLATTTAQAAGNNRVAQEEINGAYSKRIVLLNELQAKGLLTNKEVADAPDAAAISENQRLIQRKGHLTDIQQLQRHALETSAASLASMAVNFKNAQQAALELTKTIAQMIIQFLIMSAIRASFPSLFPVGRAAGGQDVNLAARGGLFPITAANGVNGVREVSTPTYFPRFNVLAGEAGREVMTVMARPRLMNVGGIAAQIGDVGPNRLALTNAGDLQRIGNGQRVQVDLAVHLQPGWEAELIGKSAHAGLNLVTHKMRERGPLSENTRRLANQ